MSWRLSWRATGAWLAASIVSALAFGLALAALDAWADTASDAGAFLQTLGVVAAVAAVGLSVGGGLLLLAAVFAARAWRLARPWTECATLASACFAVTNIGGLVQFSLDTPAGDLRPFDHPAAFIVTYLAPPFAGALMGWLYWRLTAKA